MSNVVMSSFGYNPKNNKDDVLVEEVKDDPSAKEKLLNFFEQDKEIRLHWQVLSYVQCALCFEGNVDVSGFDHTSRRVGEVQQHH